jgi:general stress protein 26
MTENFVERAWEMMEKIGTAMLVTWDGERQRARPMSAHVSRREHAVYFLTPADQPKTEQIDKFPIVTLTFADTGGQKYVVTTGRAVVSNDRAKIKELWSPFAKAWFDSSDDPNIRVLKVSPDDAEIWDTPGKLVTTVKMLAAAATDTRPDIGGNKKGPL